MVISIICLITMARNYCYSETATVTEYIIGETNSMLMWNNFSDENCDCPFKGDNCKIKVTKTTTTESIIAIEGGGWILHSGISKLEAEITLPVGGDFTKELSISNYTFLEGTTTKIISCEEYPMLIGREVDLGGITTDANGNYEVYISE